MDWLLGRDQSPAVPAPAAAAAPATADATPPAAPCHYPADCDLKTELAQLRERLADMEGTLERVERLLGHALGRGLSAADQAPPDQARRAG